MSFQFPCAARGMVTRMVVPCPGVLSRWMPPPKSLTACFVAVLAGSLGLLAALDAGAFIALSATHLRQNAGLGAASLKTLQSAVQGLAFLDMDFRHLYFPPSDAPGYFQSAL
mgnify:CR=1 FL=1